MGLGYEISSLNARSTGDDEILNERSKTPRAWVLLIYPSFCLSVPFKSVRWVERGTGVYL